MYNKYFKDPIKPRSDLTFKENRQYHEHSPYKPQNSTVQTEIIDIINFYPTDIK